MDAKEDCRKVLAETVGQATADMIDRIPAENCVEETKKVLTDLLGPAIAAKKMEKIFKKYGGGF